MPRQRKIIQIDKYEFIVNQFLYNGKIYYREKRKNGIDVIYKNIVDKSIIVGVAKNDNIYIIETKIDIIRTHKLKEYDTCQKPFDFGLISHHQNQLEYSFYKGEDNYIYENRNGKAIIIGRSYGNKSYHLPQNIMSFDGLMFHKKKKDGSTIVIKITFQSY